MDRAIEQAASQSSKDNQSLLYTFRIKPLLQVSQSLESPCQRHHSTLSYAVE